jgi:hypothetical protein
MRPWPAPLSPLDVRGISYSGFGFESACFHAPSPPPALAAALAEMAHQQAMGRLNARGTAGGVALRPLPVAAPRIGRRCAVAVRAASGMSPAGRPVFGGKVYLDPVQKEVSAFAPATVANLGPGFDWMGCAVQVRRTPSVEQARTEEGAAPWALKWARLGPRLARDWADRNADTNFWPQGGGDTVTAKVIPDRPGVIVIERIEGDKGRLSLDPEKNCIGVAARETLKLIGQVSCGVSLTLHKVTAMRATRPSPPGD